MLRSTLRATGAAKSALDASSRSFQTVKGAVVVAIPINNTESSSSSTSSLTRHPLRQPSRSFSSPTVWERTKGAAWGAWDERSKKSAEKKFQEFVNKLATTEQWTLGDFAEEIDKTANNWMTKVVPGMSDTQEVLAARQAAKLAKAAADTMGIEATFADLANMSRLDKLRISVDAEVPKETVNMMVFQFHSMDVMQTMIRKKHLDGKPLPANEESLTVLIQSEGQAHMTPIQREYLDYVRSNLSKKHHSKKVWQATRH